MRDTYYYLMPSSSYSGLSTMAAQMVKAAKKTYGGCVMSRLAVEIMVDELKKSAEQNKLQHPRWKQPTVKLTETDFSDNIHVSIDNWSFIGYKVKDITPIPQTL